MTLEDYTYYKDKSGNVFAFTSDQEVLKSFPKDLLKLSQEDVALHISSKLVSTVSEQERSWRNSELDRSDKELNKVQDSDPKAKGTVAQWREYRKALRAWPEHKDFPSKDKRPVSPDA